MNGDAEHLVNRFEMFLDAKFPQSYRQFLLERGSAVIDGFQILGLPKREEETKEEEPDFERIKEDLSCPLCGKQKQAGRFVCYPCYNVFAEEARRVASKGNRLSLPLWVKERIAQKQKKEKKQEKKEYSALEATEILREERPDLSEKLVAICFNKGRVLCLETRETPEDDCPLIDVSLNKDEPSIPVGNTFGEWLQIHQEYERRFKEAYARVERRRKETEERKEKKFGGKKGLLPKPQDWHPIVSKTQDYIVGLTALRFNSMLNCLEVDEFYSIDHPGYQPGGSIRNLVNIIFTMARDFTGFLNIMFTDERKDGRGSLSRPARSVPKALIELAAHYGIVFEKANEGRISHQEGVSLFFAILEMPEKAQETAAILEEAGYLNKEMLTEVIAVGIWSKEEVAWLLENASRPEAVILGTDSAESRVLHNDSLNYGKSVLMAKRLQQRVLTEITGGFSSEERETSGCRLQPCGEFWILRSAKEFNLPWLMDREEKIPVEPKEQVLVLSRPKIISSREKNQQWIEENIALLAEKKKELGINKACLVLNYDFISPDFDQNPQEVLAVAQKAVKSGIYLLFPYDRCDQLDLLVEEKMRRARRMRKFPSRKASLDMQMILVPAEEWTYEKVFGHLAQNAYDYGELIANKVNITRYRNDFVVTSAAVERVASQYSGSGTVAELSDTTQKILEKWRAQVKPASQKGEYHLKMAWYKIFTGLTKDGRLREKVVQMVAEWNRADDERATRGEKGAINWSKQPDNERKEHLMLQLGEALRQIAERISSATERKKEVVLITAKESQKVLKALERENGIGYSFIRPEEMQGFLKKAKIETTPSNISDYGAVIVSAPYGRVDEPLVKFETPRSQVELPEEVVSGINSKVEGMTKEGVFVSHGDRIRSANQQIQEALKNGLPLAVSYLQPEVFVETIRGYICTPHYGRKKMVEPAYLRIAYNDGGEGKPFPIFCLDGEPKVGKHSYDFPVQIVSLRHMLGDLATECSIIRNVEIQRKEDSVEQEEFAFRKVHFFIETLLKLSQKQISIEEVEKTARIFRLLWEYSHATSAPLKECGARDVLRVHLFQSTGLDPAVVGAYRAVTELLQKYRGELVVVPRIYRRDEKLIQEFEAASPLNEEKRRKIVSGMSPSAQEWI